MSTGASSIFEQICSGIPRLPLTTGAPSEMAAVQKLEEATDRELLGKESAHPRFVKAMRAGLFLRAERPDEAHALAQEIESPEGSYWHGIVHRREPDAANSKYWFRSVGRHPVFDELAEAARGAANKEIADLARGGWDPYRFIDLCTSLPLIEASGKANASLRRELEDLQDREIAGILRFCFQEAAGSMAPATGGKR